jgi:hypothetical protein
LLVRVHHYSRLVARNFADNVRPSQITFGISLADF